MIERLRHYLTGVPDMDEEHLTLLTKVTSIHTEPKTELAVKLIREVRSDFVEHFANETALMKSVNYPYIDSHDYAHVMFLARLRDMTKVYEDGGRMAFPISTMLENNIVTLFLEHVDHYDTQYGQFIQALNKY